MHLKQPGFIYEKFKKKKEKKERKSNRKLKVYLSK